MTKVFNRYSKYYDDIYKNKDYVAEAKFIDDIILKFGKFKSKELLSIGCGTCNYEIELAKRGYIITGVDQSRSMLDHATKKITDASMENKIDLIHAYATSFKSNKNYDVAMEMFNIIGYHRTNKEINSVIENICQSLKIGGIFFFDCWYMPAVLKDPPTDRIKEVVKGNNRLIRITKSKLFIDKNIVEIKFNVINLEKDTIVDETEEIHRMRYWSLPELDNLLNSHGFEVVKAGNFMDIETLPSENKWDIFVIARRVS